MELDVWLAFWVTLAVPYAGNGCIASEIMQASEKSITLFMIIISFFQFSFVGMFILQRILPSHIHRLGDVYIPHLVEKDHAAHVLALRFNLIDALHNLELKITH